MFHSGCWGAFFIVGSFIVSILGWRTIVAVCVGYLIAQIANIIQCFYYLFKALDLSCLILFRSLLKPMGISCLIFVIMWAQNLFLPIAPIWLSLLVKVLLGIFSTIIIVQLTSPYNLYKIIKKGNIEWLPESEMIVELKHYILGLIMKVPFHFVRNTSEWMTLASLKIC